MKIMSKMLWIWIGKLLDFLADCGSDLYALI